MEHEFGYGYYIKRIQLALQKNADDALRKYELTRSQVEILHFLKTNQDRNISQKDVQDFLHISNPSVTGLVNRLEAKGFIYRSTDERDRRVRYLHLDQKAKQMNRDLIRSFHNYEAKLVENMSEEEQETLYRLLKLMLHNIEKEESE